jgi:hypothetical protein
MRIAKAIQILEASMQYRLNRAETLEEKHKMIADNNPFLHAFGGKLTVMKPYESYADWVERSNPTPDHINSIEEAREYLRKFRQEEANGQAEATTNN